MLNFCLTKSAENIDSLKNTYISDRMQTKSYEISNTEDLALKGPVLLNLFFFSFLEAAIYIAKGAKAPEEGYRGQRNKNSNEMPGVKPQSGDKTTAPSCSSRRGGH